jgi:YVTN family beta-propeller protein
MKITIMYYILLTFLIVFALSHFELYNAYGSHIFSETNIIPFTEPYASGITVNPFKDIAYVTLFDSGKISILDGKTSEVIDSILLPARAHPDDIVFNKNNGLLYLIDRGASPNILRVIDIQSKQVVANISVGINSNNIDINSNTSKVYVTSDDGNSITKDIVYVIDGSSNTVDTTIPIGIHPLGIAVNSFTNKIYVTNFESHTVSVIDGNNNTVIDTIFIGPNSFPSAVAVDMNKNIVYVTNTWKDTISVINGNTNTIINNIPVGNAPRSITVDQYSHYVFVINIIENTVSVIDGNTKTVIDTVLVGDNPWKITAHPSYGKVYVTNRYSNTVSVISPLGTSVCSQDNIQHWDKIIFTIRSIGLAQQLNLPVGTELEIKIVDQPDNIVNIKEKILEFLKVPNEEEHSIDIIDVDYALICGKQEISQNHQPYMSSLPTQLPSIEELKIESSGNVTDFLASVPKNK